AEYKDFKLFYPNMPEAAEAQNRVCDIHYKQMDKSDRDWSQTLRAEEECRTLLIEFPNSKFAPVAAQRLRNIQESLAEHEYVVGHFYHQRDMNPAAANRLDALVQQYPLYSKADEALFEAGDSYSKMGPRFRQKAGEMFAQIVREYPLSARADDAKKRLEDMEMPVPQVDQTAYARMKYEQENYRRPGLLARSTRFLRGSPDVSHAAKSGQPTMTDPKPTIPASVPVVSAMDSGGTSGTGTGTTDVTATPVSGSSALDKNPDARSRGGAASTTDANQGLPTNRDAELKKLREKQAKQQKKLQKKKNKEQNQQQPATTPATAPNNAPAASNPQPSSSATPQSSSQNPPQMQ
ncbi:MAG: outer membrane protein assembly factor BamD, partial [Acidobacteriaceae bacterium]|nr:outer membrane protein assembly factor BamD [Acidobacteriaceae bacterium]